MQRIDDTGLSEPASRQTEDPVWELRLYVAGRNPNSLSALTNLKALCETHLPGRYRIDVVDLLDHPELAESDQIVAVPTLVRKRPAPARRIIGDLSNAERTLAGLELRFGPGSDT